MVDDEPQEYRRGDPDMDHLNRFQAIVREQDDRGMALSLAAFAEDTLGRLLVVYLREEKQAKELVEGFNAPLATLSARNKVAFALGLLTRDQFEDLEVLAGSATRSPTIGRASHLTARTSRH